MLLMILLGAEASALMWLTLALAMVLTAWEARQLGLSTNGLIWWVLLVAMVHAPAYLVMRAWGSRVRR